VAPDPLHSANDASLVLRLSHPGGSVLLLGDLERAGEAALLSRHGRPHATVMKTAHHGRANATSARLLRAVRPHLAVISCRTPERGRHSPQAAVLRRLARARVPALLTGRHGDITVTLAPWGILVQSTRGPRLTLPPDPATPFPSPRALAAPVALPRSR
jgi:competence protein ComEC